ncbi:MAG: isoaspartyl peptidase/L-asparaginase [Candidatus Delongbacteria bacterium]|nr:isoaspartyl peptidase/L-asparaginase [Candidatus Delongbacteria bacterium]MBN2835811.1 isoaspartyl peptidase/L-asparaginase [Candidatus Delongbacteria bacterium]
MENKTVLVIHGGAGVIPRTDDQEKYKPYLEGLDKALKAGKDVLERGGSALDAVNAAVNELENCPSFNAGRGSVFNSNGEIEMDAAIMTGHNLKNGAVCGVRNVKNPINLARAVMENSEHSFLCSTGAEEFARKNNIEFEDSDYFKTEIRFKQWQNARDKDRVVLDHSDLDKKFGTVGAVALDKLGNLAAATSTGGITNKKYGRVGDTPIIGAGTYADNDTCAISCTGKGEDFIRLTVAYDISSRIKYGDETLFEACRANIEERLPSGSGGLIAVGKDGSFCMPYNSLGMFRGVYSSDGVFDLRIWD